MEDFPEIIDKVRLPVEIIIRPFLLDHRFEGKAVLPAVEAMQLLALSTQNYLPDTDVRFIENAKFDKFLYIEPETPSIEAFNEIELLKNGSITAKLITKKRCKRRPHETSAVGNQKRRIVLFS